MPRPPRKTVIHLVGAEPKEWTESQKALVQHKLNRLARKAADDLDAQCVVMTAFWPDKADPKGTIHMQTGGQSPYPLAVLFEYLRDMFDKTPTGDSG